MVFKPSHTVDTAINIPTLRSSGGQAVRGDMYRVDSCKISQLWIDLRILTRAHCHFCH
jgi:hypothetical protein